MKPLLQISLFTFVIIVNNFSVNAQTTVRAQVMQVNSEWQQQPTAWAATVTETFADDNALIRRHLQLVEYYLRQQSMAHLSVAQQEKRAHY